MIGTTISELHDAAREIARIGGRTTLDWFARQDLTVERKDDESPVTIADQTTETVIRDAIRRRFPHHSIVGEEHGGAITGHGIEWVIDPIDGTKTFIRSVPLYTTLVAVLQEGEPVVGVIYAPATGELVSGAAGLGARDERGRLVHVSSVTTLEDAWFGTTDPSDFLRRNPALVTTLLSRCKSTRTWADAYGYMLVARGAIDVMIDPIVSPWDVAPLGVIVREAGGVFTDLSGASTLLGESAIACSTLQLHNAVMALTESGT